MGLLKHAGCERWSMVAKQYYIILVLVIQVADLNLLFPHQCGEERTLFAQQEEVIMISPSMILVLFYRFCGFFVLEIDVEYNGIH